MAAAKRGAGRVAARFFAHQRFGSARPKSAMALPRWGGRIIGPPAPARQLRPNTSRDAGNRAEAEQGRQLSLEDRHQQAHAAAAARQQALAAKADALASDLRPS
jgi:hypothetical protein